MSLSLVGLKCCTSLACGPSTTAITTARSSATPTATTSRRSVTYLRNAPIRSPAVSESGYEDLVHDAQAVLARNSRGDWPCPSVALYPHQWLWDSCFTAIGIARYDAPRAAGELRAL